MRLVLGGRFQRRVYGMEDQPTHCPQAVPAPLRQGHEVVHEDVDVGEGLDQWSGGGTMLRCRQGRWGSSAAVGVLVRLVGASLRAAVGGGARALGVAARGGHIIGCWGWPASRHVGLAGHGCRRWVGRSRERGSLARHRRCLLQTVWGGMTTVEIVVDDVTYCLGHGTERRGGILPAHGAD